MRSLLLSVAVVLSSFSVLNAQYTPTENSMSVYADRIELTFKVEPQEEWRWYREETLVNRSEFNWSMDFETKENTYNLGFIIFRFPMSEETTGSLKELINAGQINLWKRKVIRTESTPGDRLMGGSGSMIRGVKIQTEVYEDGFKVTLSDHEFVGEIFNADLKEAFLRTKTPDTELHTEKVPVYYKRNN